MKVALCLSGISVGKNTIGSTPATPYGTHWKPALESIQKNLIHPNQCDVFFHTWANDELPQMVETYKPIAFAAEAVKAFNPKWNFETFNRHEKNWNSFVTEKVPLITYVHPKTYSQAYTIEYADKLRQTHEYMTGIKYDVVIRSRFDLEILTPIVFSNFDMNKLYFGEWKVHEFGIDDVFFAGSSDNMAAACSLYSMMNGYFSNPEYVIHSHRCGFGVNNIGATMHEPLFFHLQQGHLLDKTVRKWNSGTDFKIKRV